MYVADVFENCFNIFISLNLEIFNTIHSESDSAKKRNSSYALTYSRIIPLHLIGHNMSVNRNVSDEIK